MAATLVKVMRRSVAEAGQVANQLLYPNPLQGFSPVYPNVCLILRPCRFGLAPRAAHRYRHHGCHALHQVCLRGPQRGCWQDRPPSGSRTQQRGRPCRGCLRRAWPLVPRCSSGLAIARQATPLSDMHRLPTEASSVCAFAGNQFPPHLDGTLPGDAGFDPLSLGSDPAFLKWYVLSNICQSSGFH